MSDLVTDNDWYDYGARFYDPALGRFHTQDRFSEKYLDFSPYQYAANNPILFIDVNGDSIDISGIEDNESLMEVYNQWGETDAGKDFIDAYSDDGHFGHVSVVFEQEDIGYHSAENLTTVVDKETGEVTKYNKENQNLGQDGIDAANAENGKYIRNHITLSEGKSPNSDYEYVDAVDDIVHETQHFRQNHYTLSQGNDWRSVGKQHEIMNDKGYYYKGESTRAKEEVRQMLKRRR